MKFQALNVANTCLRVQSRSEADTKQIPRLRRKHIHTRTRTRSLFGIHLLLKACTLINTHNTCTF